MQRMKISITNTIGALFLSHLLVMNPMTVSAQQGNSNEEIISLLKEKNIITAEEADSILSRYEKERAGGDDFPEATGRSTDVVKPKSPKPYTIVVPKGQRYLEVIRDEVARDIKEEVKEQVKNELKDEIAKEIKLEAFTGSVPAWTKRIRFGGDFRLRYQGDYFDEGNPSGVGQPMNPTEILNTTEDRDRLRYRVRISAKAQINTQTEVGIRLASGNEKDPISTNDTLGDYQNKDTITFDQAYLKWTPIPEISTWTGKLDFFGGRMPNPFFSTDLVWDSDLNFEGIATNFEYPFNPRFTALFNAGIFPLEEIELSSDDKWFYGVQMGVKYSPRTTLNFTLAAALYDYKNIQGKPNPSVIGGVGINDYTVPAFMQKGNGLFDINAGTGGPEKFALASDYKELNITAKMDIGFFDPIYISFLADYVKNLGFDKEEIAQLIPPNIDIPSADTGYQFGISVGYPKIQELGDWNTSIYYKYLEGDAVLDAFTDSDFHLGGTNAKGWTLSGQLGLGKNLWLNVRWLTSESIADVPMGIDTLQFDINSRF